jgi:hypothetical protein
LLEGCLEGTAFGGIDRQLQKALEHRLRDPNKKKKDRETNEAE